MTSAKKPAGRKQARKGDGSIYWDEVNKWELPPLRGTELPPLRGTL
jgi:hypothetical protein